MSDHWRIEAPIAIRISNLELSSCLKPNSKNNIFEICEWGENHRWVIAFLKRCENPYIEFVGDRPMAKSVNWKTFKKLCKLAYQLQDQGGE